MHAHERTLLARLGFADPDRRDSVHDLACRYLTTQSVLDRFSAMLSGAYPQGQQCYTESGIETRYDVAMVVKGLRAKHEYEIAKGRDQYRTTIGFIDVALTLVLEERCTNVKERRASTNGPDEPWHASEVHRSRVCHGNAAIEVKTNPLPIGDVVRQINLYRSYCSFDTWLLATTYPLNQSQVDCLANAKIVHVHLGQRFHDFVNEQTKSPLSNSVEV